MPLDDSAVNINLRAAVFDNIAALPSDAPLSGERGRLLSYAPSCVSPTPQLERE
jgi:hypothetical protein